MKQARKLFRDEKNILRKNHLNAEEYSFLSDCIQEDGRPTSYFKVIHKKTGVIKIMCRV